MDFGLDDEQELSIAGVCELMTSKNWEAYFVECNRDSIYPEHFVETLADMGIDSLLTPEKHGGLETDLATAAAVRMRLGRFGVPTYVLHQLPGGFNIFLCEGTQEQTGKVIAFQGTGKQVQNSAITEPGAGLDVDSPKTIYTRKNGEIYLNGSKCFIIGSTYTPYIVVMTRDGASPNKPACTEWFVDMSKAGIKVNKLEKLDLRVDSCCGTTFDDVEPGEKDIFGQEGNGLNRAKEKSNRERFFVVLINHGITMCTFEDTARYVGQRIQLSETIGRFRLIRERFTHIAIKLNSMKNILLEAAWKADNDTITSGDATICKYFHANAAFEAIDTAVQVLKDVGIAGNYRIMRFWRDLRIDRVSGGSNEIQILALGRAVFKQYRQSDTIYRPDKTPQHCHQAINVGWRCERLIRSTWALIGVRRKMINHLPVPTFDPLSGVHAALSGIGIAGPFAEQILAKRGARVIWTKNVTRADTIHVQPNYPQLSCRNLHTLSLNIFKDGGREALLKLMKTVGVFIEAGKGPAFVHRGTTGEVLWEHNLKLIAAYLSGSGQFGTEEYTSLSACNTIAQAFNGYLTQNGSVDQSMPTLSHIIDYFSGITVATAALAILYKTRGAGRGESIDIAMCKMMLRMGQCFVMDYFNSGEIRPRITEGKDSYYAGCGLYKYAGGYIVMGLAGITQINKCLKDVDLAHTLDTPEVLEDTQLVHCVEYLYGPLVEEKLDAWLATHTVAEVQARFAELNTTCARVLTIPELKGNPQCIVREPITQW